MAGMRRGARLGGRMRAITEVRVSLFGTWIRFLSILVCRSPSSGLLGRVWSGFIGCVSLDACPTPAGARGSTVWVPSHPFRNDGLGYAG
jgi:hypothetical protein